MSYNNNYISYYLLCYFLYYIQIKIYNLFYILIIYLSSSNVFLLNILIGLFPIINYIVVIYIFKIII